jgi:hypothetical protein
MLPSMPHRSNSNPSGTVKENDPEEYKRFLEAAKKAEATDDETLVLKDLP